MRLFKFCSFIFLMCIFLSSCAPQAQYEMLDRNVSGLQIETHQLGEQIKTLQKKINELEKNRNNQATLTNLARVNARLDGLESELMRLNGLVEQIQYNQERLRQELRILQGKDYQSPEMITQKESSVNQQIDSKSLQKSLESKPKIYGSIEEGVKDSEQEKEKKIDLYEQAMKLFKNKKYREAKQMFRDFIKENPGSPKVANAYFWIGECEYKRSRFEEAILEYNKVISKFPKSSKVPDALLKQGFAFAKLGDRESAKILLKKLIKKYPRSSQAKVAKRQLRLLK